MTISSSVVVELPDFLKRFKNSHIIFCPNKGNAGDALIFSGEQELLYEIGISYEFVDAAKHLPFQQKTLFYGGGGNLNDLYNNCSDFLETYTPDHLGNTLVVMPQTVFGREKLLKTLGKNVTIICRDRYSYAHVKKHAPSSVTVLLSHDAAFYVKYRPPALEIRMDSLLCVRTDSEKTSLQVDNNNIDVSLIIPNRQCVYGPGRLKCAQDFLSYIAQYEHVITNRLHVAIAAGLLGIPTDFYPNSYYKNKAVYEHSFKHFGLDKWVTFHDDATMQ